MTARIFLIAGASVALLTGAGLTAHVIKAAESQSATTTTPEELISGFARPDIIQALYDGDLVALNKNRVQKFLYLNVIVEATSSQEAFYRMQQAELMIEPRLKAIAAGKIATNREIITYLASIGMNTAWSALEEFMKIRRNSVATRTINPIDEISGINKGLLNGSNDLALIKADAEYDAKKIMFLAPTDPVSFKKIYATIKQFVRDF